MTTDNRLLVEKILARVSNPSRYTGGEYNSWLKDWDNTPLRMVMIYPDLYEIGMSNFGHLLLYSLVNETTEFLMERAYSPYLDLEEILRKENAPLFSLESRRPLKEFDVLGFSLQYELTYTNILNILELSRIPLLQAERGEDDPLILGGGPLTSYPEPISPFFDLFFVGEGEEGLIEILNKLKELKDKGAHRQDKLWELASLEGVYVPSFYEEKFSDCGEFLGIFPKKGFSGLPTTIQRRIVRNLNNSYFPLKQLVPFKEPIHDRAIVELFRGCGRGCRFCLAGYLYRPPRFKDLELVKKQAISVIEDTGYEALTLASFNSTDYPNLKELISYLLEHYDDKLAISLPSLGMRPTSVELACISDKKRTNLTFAPEAATIRLREVIKKNLTEEEILLTVQEAAKKGLNSLKLYFMIGLPTETEEDISAIVSLCKEIISVGNRSKINRRPFHLNITISPFVPKPHTPLERERQAGLEEIEEKMRYLRNELKEPRFTLREHNAQMSYLEGIMSRGDRRLHRVIEKAFQKGARFDGWEEHFNYSLYEEAFKEEGIEPETYLKSKKEGPLYWDIISTGISKEYLKKEWEDALSLTSFAPEKIIEEETVIKIENLPDSNQKETVRIPKEKLKELVEEEKEQEKPKEKEVYRWLLKYGKTEKVRFISHLEEIRALERALRRSKIALLYSQGFTVRPLISFGPPLPVGYTSQNQLMEIRLSKKYSPLQLISLINPCLPEGLILLEVKELDKNTPALGSNFFRIVYRLGVEGTVDLESWNNFLLLSKYEVKRESEKRGKYLFDVRPYLTELRVLTDNMIEVTTIYSPQGSVKMSELENILGVKIITGERIFLELLN